MPPPSHLALLNTLIVHPAYTTRVEKHGQDVSSLALAYLTDLVTLVGPVNANLRAAFQFHSIPLWSRRRASSSDMDESEDERERDRLEGRLANESSVWNCGQDFWSTVGWAFNCSTLHPHRWRYWKAWLEFMLGVLEADWKERSRLDTVAHDTTYSDSPPTAMREESIIIMYMKQTNGPQGAFKSIIKALFADGGSLSASAFTEVFDKEPRGPKKDSSNKRKRADTLDIENDKFGDYFDDEALSSGVSEPPTPEKPRDARMGATFGASYPGMVDSIDLRLRLFTLISTATFDLRKRSEINKLYESYASALKVLPLEMFALFISQRVNPMPTEMHVTTIKELFHLLLPSAYRDPHKVDPENEAEGRLTMTMLEACYACHPANTVGIEDNVKLSLVVESSLQLLWLCDSLEYTDSFADAVQGGIDARQAKVKKKRTGKTKAEADDVLAREMLDASGERVQLLLDVLMATGQ